MNDQNPTPEVGPGRVLDDSRYFIKAGQGSRHTLFPGVEILTTTGDQMTLSLVKLDARAVVPEHAHPHEQMGMVISGRLEFTIGGETRTVGPGDLWRIPGNVPHQVRNLEGPAVVLDIFHPIREDYR